MLKHIMLILALCLFAFPAYASSETEHYMLQNGLEVYLSQDKAVATSSVCIGYKVGSRNEQVGKTGISHLIEHLLFRGTKNFPEARLNKIYNKTGASYNAFTAHDMTVYYEILPSKYLETAIAIESDRMTNSELSEESIAKEKKIVISELEMYKNMPAQALSDEIINGHFRSHSYRWPIIGFKSDVNSLTRSDITGYYRTYYVPNNAILSVSGNFDTKKAKELIDKYFSSKERGKAIPSPSAIEPKHESQRSISMENPGKTNYIEYAFNSDKMLGKDKYALDVIAAILESGKSSRLYKALVKTGIASGAGASSGRNLDPGTFEIYMDLMPGASREQAESVIEEEILKLQNSEVPAKELEKAKNLLKSSNIMRSESLSSVAMAKVIYGIYGNSSYMEEFEKNIDKVTAEQVKETAKKYLDIKTCTKGYSKGAISKANLFEAKNNKASLSGSGADLSFEKFTLKNGITVIVKQNRKVNSISISGHIRNSGSYMDPEGKEGIAKLTGAMLDRGTSSKTLEEIAETEDFNGINTHDHVYSEIFSFSHWMLKSKADTGIALFADEIINPSFPEKELEKCRKELLAEIDSNYSEPSSRAKEELYRQMFSGHRRGHLAIGTKEGVSSITRSDIVKFHKGCYRPENLLIILYGNITPAEGRKLAEKHFGSWKSEGAPMTPPSDPKDKKLEKSETFVNIDGQIQNSVMFGGYGVNIKEKDFAAFQVFNYIMGGSTLTSRIGQDIREKQGLCYGINSFNTSGSHMAIFMIQALTAPKNVSKVIDSTKNIINRMLSEGVTEEEFNDAKEHLINSHLMYVSENGGQVNTIEQIEYHGLSKDYANEILKAYENLTLEEVNAAGRKYLNPDNMKIVVAGSK